MWHYGKATVDNEPEGTFATKDEAVNAAQEASMYHDDVLQVWSDDEPATAECLCWGGTVYSY